MNKLCIGTGAFLGGWLAWIAAERIGFEIGGCYLASGLGSMAGVWAGWRIARRFDS